MKSYLTVVLTFTVFVLLFMTGWFLFHQRDVVYWSVEVQREETAASAADEAFGWPDSLLEGEVIDINTASEHDLQRLPGIGPGRAKAIVSYRQEQGPFSDIKELKRVEGIGPGIFESVRAYVTVGEARKEHG